MKPALKQAEPGRYNTADLPQSILPKSDKNALRREMKRLLSLLPPEEFDNAGREAAVFAQSLPLWNRCRTILLFVSTKTEINTMPLLEAALGKGKAVFAPRIEAGQICFYRVKTPNGPWKNGSLGICEPLPETPLEKTDFPALIFTPGLAFDRRGNRLGHGGGFYDRFFAGLEAGGLEFTAAGLCLKAQILGSVPVDKWDRPVDYLIDLSGNQPGFRTSKSVKTNDEGITQWEG